MTNTPYKQKLHQKSKIHKDATKKFDSTAIADRLRTVSWSSYSHPTGVVNRFTGPTFPLTATVVLSKGQTSKNL